MTPFEKQDIASTFQRLETLLGFLKPENSAHPLLRSVFIERVICLRDLMYKTERYAKRRVNFVDDINVTNKVTDIYDLIKYVRDAMCHHESSNHYLEWRRIRASFNVSFGKGGFKIGEYEQRNPYEDDACFFLGPQRIFLKRHIWRSVSEAKALLEPLI